MIHYSKYLLNTFSSSPYFLAHVPEDYPTGTTLIASRAYQRLPPRFKELADLSKQWTKIHRPDAAIFLNMELYYDDEGYELNPETGKRLTDAEIDAEWDAQGINLDGFVVEDIPLPSSGFADPATWEEPKPPEDEVDYEGPDREQVLLDIRSRGREYTSKYYGVDASEMDDDELAEVILDKIGAP